MVVTKEIPRFLYVGKFRVKVWYRGQPVTCDVCHVKGHKAADCPSKGKCFVCKEEGHLSRDCTRRVNVPVTEAAPQSPPCGQASGGLVLVVPLRTCGIMSSTLILRVRLTIVINIMITALL